MNRAVYLLAIPALLLSTVSASAQSEAASSVAPAPITTRLSAIALPEPVTDEGFATIRIADETGEAVYRGMRPVVPGTRSLDLSAVRVPAAGRYSVRVIYPGGALMQEIETPYTVSGAAAISAVAVGGL
jgi:hypothetical protein